jgi:hypothetical protein
MPIHVIPFTKEKNPERFRKNKNSFTVGTLVTGQTVVRGIGALT